MKERGKDFDLSKEPVTKETIRAIVGECRRMFNVDLPLLKEDFPIERALRIGYTEDGEMIDVDHDGKFTVIPEEIGEWHIFFARNNGENTYSIFLTENLKNKKLIDLNDDYDYSNPNTLVRIRKSEKLSYTCVVDFDENSSFMQMYIAPKAYIGDFASRRFSSLQVKRVEELLRQGFPVGSLDISNVMRDPISNPIIPSEEMAENLLEFMRGITKVERFSPGPFM